MKYRCITVGACFATILLAASASLISPATAETSTSGATPTELISITATRRVTPTLHVPAHVSTLFADDLKHANIHKVKELDNLSASIGSINSYSESFGQLIRIRGVTTSGADIGLESTVGVTIDGVPLPRANLALANLQGVKRIELLRGPQGTLFGNSTTGGVINVLTQEPVFERSASATANIGNREFYEARFSANDIVVENRLATRIDLLVASDAGYIRNTQTKEHYAGRTNMQSRAQLLWTPTDAWDIRLIADALVNNGRVNGQVFRKVGATGPAISALSGMTLTAQPDGAPITQIDNLTARFDRSRMFGLNLQSNWRSDIGTATAILSFRNGIFRRSFDVDNGPADIFNDPRDGERYDTLTAELRWRAKTERLDNLFGLFANRETIKSRDAYVVGVAFATYANLLSGGAVPAITGLSAAASYPPGTGGNDIFRQTKTDFAAFYHGVWKAADRLSLTAGLRFDHVAKSLTADITTNNPGCAAAVTRFGRALTGVPAALQGVVCIPNIDPRYDGTYGTSMSESALSGTVSALFRLNEQASLYASYQRGFKPGGYQFDRSGMIQTAPDAAQLAFKSEHADAFEIGAKASLMDGTLNGTLSAFDTRLGNYQFSYFTGVNRRAANVPELSTRGVELEASWRPDENFTAGMSAIYQNAVFGDSGFPAALVQLQGTTAPIAPRWIVTANAAYSHTIPDSELRLTGALNLRWQSKSNIGASAIVTPDFLQEAYAIFGGRLVLAAADEKWEVAFWGRNLFDRKAWTIASNTTFQPGSITGFVIEPRSFGASLSMRWL